MSLPKWFNMSLLCSPPCHTGVWHTPGATHHTHWSMCFLLCWVHFLKGWKPSFSHLHDARGSLSQARHRARTPQTDGKGIQRSRDVKKLSECHLPHRGSHRIWQRRDPQGPRQAVYWSARGSSQVAVSANYCENSTQQKWSPVTISSKAIKYRNIYKRGPSGFQKQALTLQPKRGEVFYSVDH